LEGEVLREIADAELRIQGWQWCDMEELADLVIEHVVEDPLKALRLSLVMLPIELHETYDEMVAGHAVEISEDDEFFIVALHQVGECIGTIISSVSPRCKIKTKNEGEEYAFLIGNFLNNIRLRSNNGWTPEELMANSPITTSMSPSVRTNPRVGRT